MGLVLKSPEEIKAEIAQRTAERMLGLRPNPSGTPVEPFERQMEQAYGRWSKSYKWIHPFADAAQGLIDYAQNPEGRFYLGIHDLDVMTRGFGRKELVYVTGRAHSGKTQLVLQGIVNNPERRVIFFTPDETSELVLSKLVAMTHDIDAEQVEGRIKDGDPDAIEIVRKTASHDYRNLIVIDESLNMGQMMDALREAEDFWGARAEAVVIDFLELIPSDDDGHDGVVAKSQALKRFAHDADVPVICLHQASRTSGSRGQSAGMGAMRYGGETEAIFVLEVFRKREDRELDEWERLDHEDTVSVNLCKNKRPPSKKGEVDFYLNPETGRISPLPPTIKREPVGNTIQPPVNPVVDWQRDQLSMGSF